MEKSRVLEPRIAWVRNAAAVLTLYVPKYSLRLSHYGKENILGALKTFLLFSEEGETLDSCPPR